MSAEGTKEASEFSVAIVGAGFSGLSLAWALQRENIAVEIFETTTRTGGLIATDRQAIAPVESAANAIMASREAEELLKDIDIEPLRAGFKSKKRYIFRARPAQWALSLGETLIALGLFVVSRFLRRDFQPKAHESVAAWGRRCFGEAAVKFLFSPALQGIYGIGAEHLSAQLILDSVMKYRTPRGKLRGSLAPAGGMGELIDKLTTHLQKKSVRIHLAQKTELNELKKKFSAVILALPVQKAAELLAAHTPKAAQLLSQVPALPLVSVGLAFSQVRQLKGFGCLFPESEGFNSLGVLFSSDIFSDRGPIESETWILNKIGIHEDQILGLVLADRKKLTGAKETPVMIRINAWAKALPLYGFELLKFLRSDFYRRQQPLPESPYPIYLTGNYLGGIGLSKILNYNIQLARSIALAKRRKLL
jgi:oxygen-dependent protoporphyrinogen oxidase